MNLMAPLTTSRKASIASVGGASLVAIPQAQQFLDIIGLICSIQFSKLELLLGVPSDMVWDSTDFWKWIAAALMLHLAVYFMPNASQPSAAPAESPDHA